MSIAQNEMNCNNKYKVSIVIPVKNGGYLFKKVLEALSEQDYQFGYEVICVDSGSKDQSISFIKNFNYRLIEIKPSEFGHGKTRNLGASIGTGDFIVFLTHDAIPANSKWLSTLVEPLIKDPDVAGSFSRHIAHDNCNPFVKWELETHFEGLKKFEVCHISNREAYDSDKTLQQIFHFFSDNSSCIRRSIWKKYPLPNVEFAEDQIWAKTILEQGFKKAFAYNSIVKHSHEFGLWDTLRRSFDEAKAFNKLFGYVLTGNLISLLKSGAYLLKRDLHNAFKYGWYKKHPIETISRCLKAFLVPLGHFLGGNQNLTFLFGNILSRDNWIKRL